MKKVLQLGLLLLLFGCESVLTDVNPISTSGFQSTDSYIITYKVSGAPSENIQVSKLSYTYGDGSVRVIEKPTLPWSRELSAKSNTDVIIKVEGIFLSNSKIFTEIKADNGVNTLEAAEEFDRTTNAFTFADTLSLQ
ncbi:hypothetical protein [Algivirga pacifica]|uniref:Uncharacterized protein n=1 Tax=Algivirga pacifica TaxID=1162670 RepID=A0ABP9D0B4_9BACT